MLPESDLAFVRAGPSCALFTEPGQTHHGRKKTFHCDILAKIRAQKAAAAASEGGAAPIAPASAPVPEVSSEPIAETVSPASHRLWRRSRRLHPAQSPARRRTLWPRFAPVARSLLRSQRRHLLLRRLFPQRQFRDGCAKACSSRCRWASSVCARYAEGSSEGKGGAAAVSAQPAVVKTGIPVVAPPFRLSLS